MVNISKIGDSAIKFTFTDNDRYLYNGEITLPLNSLILEFDTSDLVIFKKIDGDVFVTFLLGNSNFDSKDSLIDFYKTSMVGATGGGSGSGVTPSEVQTMIDESISGKADSSDVYTTGQTSGATEIANALNAKLDATAYTPTVVDAALNVASTNPVQNKALYDELRVENETLLTFSDSIATNYPSGCTTIKVEVSGTGDMDTIGFYDSNWGQIGQVVIDTVHGYIVVDNNDFEGSTYTINGNIVTISYPSITNVKYLMANGNLYTYKAVTSVSTLKDVVSGKVDVDVYSAFTSNTNTALFGLDNRLFDTERKVNSAWTKSIRDVSWYPSARGLTLSYSILSGGSFQYISQPLDESLKFDNNNKLGVYATGSTYTVGGNQYVTGGARYTLPISNALKTKKVVIQLNQSYTGSTPTSNAIQAFYYDNNGVSYNPKWNYDSDLDSFTNSTEYTGITLTYDQVGKTITLELDSSYAYIGQIRTAKNIAPADDLTNERYYIGLVTVYTNEYKLQEALDNKQNTLSAGTGISISGNVISATGGECTVEETVVYDRNANRYTDYYGDNKLTYVAINYLGDKSQAFSMSLGFSIGDASSDLANSYIYFDYVNHSASTDISTDYLTVEYINDIQDFKVSITSAYQSDYWIKDIYNLTSEMAVLIPYYTINSGSPCTVITTDVVGLVEKVKGDVNSSTRSVNLESSEKNLSVTYYTNAGGSSNSTIGLEEIDGTNNKLKPNIKVGLGVSGWTEINLSENSCQLSENEVKGFTTFRISGDTNELSNWGLQIAVGYNNNYTWDSVNWDDNENTFVLSKTWDMFSAATATWDSNTGYLTVTYPQTVTVDGEERQTAFYSINSSQCQYGYTITKFEYYGELQQPLKPYVQETRAALGGLSLSHVTQAQYDAMEQAGTLDSNTLYVITDN